MSQTIHADNHAPMTFHDLVDSLDTQRIKFTRREGGDLLIDDALLTDSLRAAVAAWKPALINMAGVRAIMLEMIDAEMCRRGEQDPDAPTWAPTLALVAAQVEAIAMEVVAELNRQDKRQSGPPRKGIGASVNRLRAEIARRLRGNR